jgi:predicted dehydrogenase
MTTTIAPLLDASEMIRLGVIGAGGRGRYLTAQFTEQGAQVTAVCDVYEPNLQSGLRTASTGARGYVDYRRMLEDRSIDAVISATPDHMHAQPLLDAVDAGKDVSVEKPLAHNIEDGFRMVEAVRRSGRIVAVGTQRRSYDIYQEAKSILDSGAAGDIRLVTAHWLNRWTALRNQSIKGILDGDLFQGPAAKRSADPVRYFNRLISGTTQAAP